MLLVECPSHGRSVLVSERRITALSALPGGTVVRCRCYCGTDVTTVLRKSTARRRAEAAQPAT
jgi:hypothetical protein